MKRSDMQKGGKRMEAMTGMWKNPHERRKKWLTEMPDTTFSRSKTKLTR